MAAVGDSAAAGGVSGVAAHSDGAGPAAGGVVVRILSYNVRSLRDDRRAVARVIRACAPDVVCVQEAPRFLGWRAACADLAHSSGLYVVGGGRSAGAMLLLGSLRARVCWRRDVLLTRTPGLHQRGLAMAVLEITGATFGVASLHLSLDAAERLRQAGEVLDHLDTLTQACGGGPVVLSGDVNERPSGPAFARLAGRLQDGWAVAPAGGEHTSPASRPVQRIDAVFASADATVVECGVPEVPGIAVASDHAPVLAVLRIPHRRAAGPA